MKKNSIICLISNFVIRKCFEERYCNNDDIGIREKFIKRCGKYSAYLRGSKLFSRKLRGVKNSKNVSNFYPTSQTTIYSDGDQSVMLTIWLMMLIRGHAKSISLPKSFLAPKNALSYSFFMINFSGKRPLLPPRLLQVHRLLSEPQRS